MYNNSYYSKTSSLPNNDSNFNFDVKSPFLYKKNKILGILIYQYLFNRMSMSL